MDRPAISGLTYVLASTMFWGVAAVFSKVGVGLIGPWSAVLVRSVVFASIVIGYVLWKRNVDVRSSLGSRYGIAAGITMGLAVIAVRFAYSLYDVSRVVPLQRLSILVTVLLGIVVLEERITRRKSAGIGCAMVAFVLLAP
jgi:transporter family protein